MTATEPQTAGSPTVDLRPVGPEDSPFFNDVMGLASDLYISTTGYEVPWGSDKVEQYITVAVDSARRGTGFVFVIVAERGAPPVGVIELLDVRWIHRTARVGIAIWNARDRSRGLGTLALQALVTLAFDRLNLERLHATLFVDNVASRAIFERAGFALEGVLRSHVFAAGRRHDVAIYGLLKDVSQIARFPT